MLTYKFIHEKMWITQMGKNKENNKLISCLISPVIKLNSLPKERLSR